MSDVTIHIDETLDALTFRELQGELARVAGIEKINASEKHPHLMVVSYDGNLMNSGNILHKFTNQGLHAELIGL